MTTKLNKVLLHKSVGFWILIGLLIFILAPYLYSGDLVHLVHLNTGPPVPMDTTTFSGIPVGVATDASGHIIMVTEEGTVYSFSTTKAAPGSVTLPEGGDPVAITMNNTGNIYIAKNNGNIYRLNIGLRVLAETTVAETPVAITADTAGSVYIATANGSIYKKNANLRTIFKTSVPGTPTAIDANNVGNIFVTTIGGRVYRLNTNLTVIASGSVPGNPVDIAADGAGHTIVASGSRLYSINAANRVVANRMLSGTLVALDIDNAGHMVAVNSGGTVFLVTIDLSNHWCTATNISLNAAAINPSGNIYAVGGTETIYSISAAIAHRPWREERLIISFVRSFLSIHKETLPRWNNHGNAAKASTFMGAVLYVLANPKRFHCYPEFTELINRGGLSYYQAYFTQYLDKIKVLDDVGTDDGFKDELWAAVGGYQLPRSIHGFMLSKKCAYFARIQARYTREHYYPLTVFYYTPSLKPKYFDPVTKVAIMQGEFLGSPELYFGNDDLLLSAGGRYKGYYQNAILNVQREYHFLARPTILITRGNFGQDWDSKEDVSKDALIMLGKRRSYYKSECNIWVYKNFAYGYEYYNRGVAPRGYRKGWPQRYPGYWNNFRMTPDKGADFSIGTADFRVFDFVNTLDMVPKRKTPDDIVGMALDGENNYNFVWFRDGKVSAGSSEDLDKYRLLYNYKSPDTWHIPRGYYIVMAKVRKNFTSTLSHLSHWNYRRGFIEIIPGHMFNSSSEIRSRIQSLHTPGDFPDSPGDKPYYYRLVTTGERIRMHPKMGSKYGGSESCTCGIEEIKMASPHGIWQDLPFEEIFIPKNVKNSNDLAKIPLITVWELDSSFRATGQLLVETLAPGKIIIRNFNEQTCIEIDSSVYDNPKERELACDRH